MSVIIGIIVGAISGCIAGAIMKSEGGWIRNIILGLAGGFVGNLIFGIIGLIIGVPMFAVAYTLIRQVVLERLDERAKDGELTPEFLRDTLEIKGHIEDSGLFHDDESDSQYLQHLILLEDIAQKPSDIKETADELLHDLSE